MAAGLYLPEQVPNFGNGQLNPFGLNVTFGPSPLNNIGGVIIDFTSYISPDTLPLPFINLIGYGPSTTNITINNVTLINAVITSVYCDDVSMILNNVSISGSGSEDLKPIMFAPAVYTPSSVLTINGEFYNNTGFTMISAFNATVKIENSYIHSNTFTNLLIGFIFTLPGSSITNTTIVNNDMSSLAVQMGSIIEVYQGSSSLINSTLSGNHGLFSLFHMRLADVSIQETKITNNSATVSSLIYGSESSLEMINTTFTSDHLDKDFYFLMFENSKISLTNVEFNEQSRVVDIIACTSGSITLNNVTNNDSGTGLIDCNYPDLCTIQGNQPDICPNNLLW
ncbi:hypothetical protein SAMD00019534_094650 [Acytostelium subglobosum LB1]|uniref:hypothetical protein n=1 Tax=Acytostelium subglobosum LB1 TaxID=1410327 RepID=UPI000644B177|nr:hypothetical protein SAMD00019534_094650 [Acytostelium subglobosum LB1]GAM26290.1 hypothetical protein SAMD00019534_094650 [Acytostelium subglobosum LB1]|eukprot:XP_012750844.1 hypothetical protein SAMD00019534_094650 [Acytostelium subglobosum LB1]